MSIQGAGSHVDQQLCALLSIGAAELQCKLTVGQDGRVPVEWALLAAHTGVYTLSGGETSPIQVQGCDGDLPVFTQDWALKLGRDCVVVGLPFHKFQPGPHGSLVWRDQAVADSSLQQRFSFL